MLTQNSKIHHLFKTQALYMVLHILILLLSIFLVVCISIDSFHNEAFYDVPRFMKVQFWICVIFLADFFIEFFLAPNKWHYISTHFLFFLVSIPYNSIITHYGWTFDPQLTYCLRYIPLIRGGYAMSIVVSWFTYNKATGLFISYLATLLFTIYFASLAFYLFEHGVNPLVVNYDDALWWAFMDATTVGSNITAVTTVGRILSVLLAALGMMMFPIFTVYVTNILTKHHQMGAKYGDVNFTTPMMTPKATHQDMAVENDAAQPPVAK
ncbi:MAG: potassium channel family protein [Muribaculaceae bacterium]|nr:potassium channel family protein [Muribaculaceae bacterium]